MAISETTTGTSKVKTFTITVSARIQNGSATFKFSRDRIKAAVGTDILTFRRKEGESWAFTGIAVYPKAGPQPDCEAACATSLADPFQLLNLAADNIVIEDTNPGGSKEKFCYTVCITASDAHWCSDPEIINKDQ